LHCVRRRCSLFETSLRVHAFVFSSQRCGTNVLYVLWDLSFGSLVSKRRWRLDLATL
jgi:hypothetical protein